MIALEIRPGQERDLPALVRIYDHYVTSPHITFDTRAFDVEERRPWVEQFSGSGPYRLIVAEVAEQPVGYATSLSFRRKPAYVRSVETTVYLDPSVTGRGVGSKLYASLLDALAHEACVHRAYGGIALPNSASITLHERLGFSRVGTFREVGFKFRKYWDVSWYEKHLCDSIVT